jgi:hypothetical protein
MVRRLRWQALAAGHTAPAAGIGLVHARVNREAFASHQLFGHAATDCDLEHLAQEIAVTEAAVTVLGKGGVIGHVALQPQAAEPAIRQRTVR